MFNSNSAVAFGRDVLVSSALSALRDLLARRNEIDLRAAESDKSEAAHETLLRLITPLVDAAIALVNELQSQFEGDADDPDSGEVADVCALAGMVLRERRALLIHAQPCVHWTYLENCERSLRSLTKSAKVVTGTLSRYARLPETPGRGSDLGSALTVRRHYATLCRAVSRARRDSDLASRLRAASKGISILLGSDAYALMRLGDRREIRMLQFRIQSWLSGAQPSESEGRHLWEELMSVVSLLNGISQRSELFAHDGAAIARLAQAARDTADIRSLRALAEPLFGLDPELDELLDVQDSRDLAAWQQTITRVALERGIRSISTNE